ncbi:MAG: amidohydrolase family protein [Gammaproteobacteria bacterium]|nr:amidohydrolase family protein [Gammaproteobacteria bacterium]
MKKNTLLLNTVLSALITMITASPSLMAADDADQTAPPEENKTAQVLITNVNIFDGNSEILVQGQDVLIEGKLIKKIGQSLELENKGLVIDGGGRTMTPGLIDMHQHLMLGGPDGLFSTGESIDFATTGAIAAQNMYAHLLMKGITTVRDIGGNSLGLAKGVRMGWMTGPRIYSAGPPIGPLGGHGDVGGWNQHLSQDESVLMGNLATTSTVDEVIKQARWNFRKGAAFLKVMPGGGVSTEFDPLEVISLTLDEMKAAVAIAEDNKTYVAAHAYRDDAVNRAIDAGVKVIEHNFLVSEETIQRMAKEDIILSLQGYMAGVAFAHPENVPWYTPEQIRKAKSVHTGTLQMIKWARKHKLFIISGSDMFAEQWPITKRNITIEVELFEFTSVEALRHATGNAGKVLEMSGPARNPYRDGPLGVIQEGAYADILLWDGDPTQDIMIIEDEDKLDVIMKDGEIFKNTIVDVTDPAYRPSPEMRIMPDKVFQRGNSL